LMLLTAKAARKASIPIITQPHGGLPIISNSLWLKRIYDWLLGSMEIKGISALIAFHDIERRQALAHGIPEECVEIIPNGIECSGSVELPEAGIFRRRFGLADDKPLILFLGRVNKIKGTDMLIHAFARLENLNAQMVIAGPDDGQMGQVKSLIHRYNLGNRVSVIGPLSDIDKVAAFQDSDLFVLPSRYDAFPTTIMEACLRGIPMVITDRCGSANLVRDRVAEVVPFDAEAFASAMQRLLTDRELYNRFRDNCHAIITDTFSIGTVIDRLEKVYRRVISEKKERKI
jgi:glycosyltransferase involved in cell wall biosynthesis